jgi:N-methylhydantoinase A
MPASVGSEEARGEVKRRFDDAHDLRYSHSAPEESADIVSLRVSAIGRLNKPEFPRIAKGDAVPPPAARRGERAVNFEGAGSMSAPVYDRAQLLQGNVIHGPAIIEEVASTTVVEPGDRVTVNEFGHLIMQLGEAA